MKKKNKVINFIKNHKNGLINLAYYAGGFTLGAFACKYVLRPRGYSSTAMGIFEKFIRDVKNDENGYLDMMTAAFEEPMIINQLGEAGEKIIENGVDVNGLDDFTHLILLRKSK